MKLLRQLRAMFGKPDELKRPTFPVDSRLTEIRGDVNKVKAVIRVKQPPIDYGKLGVLE